MMLFVCDLVENIMVFLMLFLMDVMVVLVVIFWLRPRPASGAASEAEVRAKLRDEMRAQLRDELREELRAEHCVGRRERHIDRRTVSVRSVSVQSAVTYTTVRKVLWPKFQVLPTRDQGVFYEHHEKCM